MKTNFDEAMSIIDRSIAPLDSEQIQARNATGRILAEDIKADRDYPPFFRAAMDGYAVRLEELSDENRIFPVDRTVLPGKDPGDAPASGHVLRIMTGASVPLPLNVVVRFEDSEQTPHGVKLKPGKVRAYANIARQGEDARSGDVILESGSRITSPFTGFLSSFGYNNVLVYRKPRISMIATGEELSTSGNGVTIRDYNTSAITGIAAEWGHEVVARRPESPDRESIHSALVEAIENSDMILLSGGISKGDTDFVPEILEELGVKFAFRGVDMKPGKPVTLGLTNDGRPVLALPGNPLAASVIFRLFGMAVIHKLTGLDIENPLHLPVCENTKEGKGNVRFVGARIRNSQRSNDNTDTDASLFCVTETDSNGSGDYISLAQTDGILRLGEGSLSKGSADFYFWDRG